LWKRPSLDQSVHQLPASHSSMSWALPPNFMRTRILTTTCRLFLILSFVRNVQLKTFTSHRINGCTLKICSINKYREFCFYCWAAAKQPMTLPILQRSDTQNPALQNNLCSCTFGPKVTSTNASLYQTTTNRWWWWWWW
jgi:hypothetical protein